MTMKIKLRDSGVSWMGSIPAHWRTKKLRYVTSLVSDRSDQMSAGERYIGLEHIEAGTGKFATHTESMQEDAKSAVSKFNAGDVLFGKLRPYLAKAVVADTDGVCSSEILVYRPSELVSEYLKHTLLLSGFIQEVDSSTYGTKMPRANSDFIARLNVPVPPRPEQIAIAKYLNVEISRADTLIAEKIRLIELLKEWRGNIISEFTFGTNCTSPRVETGNEFIPNIPIGWKIVPIVRYVTIGNGSTPLRGNNEFWFAGTLPWLNSSVVNQDDVREGSDFVTEFAVRKCHLPVVPAESVLIALTGQGKTRGQVAMLRIEATINQHLAFLSPDPAVLDAEFLFWVLTGMYQALRIVSDGQGGTKGALTCEELGRFNIPIPPLSEQKEIVARLYRETREVDRLMSHVRGELELLNELRSVTLTDAVLGRIDVSAYLPSTESEEVAA